MIDLEGWRATRKALFDEYGMKLHVRAYQAACVAAWHATDTIVRREAPDKDVRVIFINNTAVPVLFQQSTATVLTALPRASVLSRSRKAERECRL